jgi:hypothetical protein
VTDQPQLVVRTHVGRDLLQTAQLFRTLEAAVWEYVANGLEYVDPGVKPKITVDLDNRKKAVTVTDNGRGMDHAGLQQFFTMHGENPDRKAGKRGRGKFGTGKSAAFGIAPRLRVSTVRDGQRNVVELRLDDIKASEGEDIPIHWLVREETDADNGTVISIEDILLPRLQPEPLIRNIERHLPYWRAAEPTVYVGAHLCEPWQPSVASTHTFQPNDEQQKVIGNVELTIKVAQAPLPDGLYGIAVTTAPGVLVAIESAGIEAKEFGSYLFGEVEVAALESSDDQLAAYDLSRSLKLNPANPVAAVLIGFIGYHLDQVRKGLVDEQRKKRREHQFQQLEEAATRIAKLLNEDLSSVADRLADIRSMRRRAGRVAEAGGAGGGSTPDEWVEGDDAPGLLDLRPHEPTTTAEPKGREAPDLARPGHPDPAGIDKVSPRGGTDAKPRPRGGLEVHFDNLGPEQDRSIYDPGSKIILINLDHPMVEAAIGLGGVDDLTFRRLAYEIAFGQYALAVSQEFLKRDPDLTADDVLYEVRDTMRRITRRAANLYQDGAVVGIAGA